jgi:hypothetical protein
VVPPAAAAAVTCDGLTITHLGTAGNDTLTGTAGDDVFHGLGGNDLIKGLAGNDVVCGGDGDDTIYGGPGNDVLYGGAGADKMFGRADADVVVGGPGPDVIEGNDGADTLRGLKGNDSLFGGDGSDTLEGGLGRDKLYAGPGNDIVNGHGGNDLLFGGTGADQVDGGVGDDHLFGGDQNDWLHGRAGVNKAAGGPGWDVCYRSIRTDPCEGPTFLETFDGEPSSPTPFTGSNDITVSINSRIVETRDQLAPMQAQHGSDCSGPPNTHLVTDYEDALFRCRNHMMTAINSGPLSNANYAVAGFSPNYLLDFSGGEAVIEFDVSTLRASKRDWWEVWITPYKDLQRISVQNHPTMQGVPENGVVVSLKAFTDRGAPDVRVVKNFQITEIDGPVEWIGYESFLTPSATVRSTFEIRLSKNHIVVGMPDENFYWVSEDIPGGLPFSKGVVQFGHNSYDVFQCDEGCESGPNTWHWDNISLAPAEPITALAANRRVVNPSTSSFVTFSRGAPSGSHLQFTGVGKDLEVSFNGGATWQPAVTQHNREIYDWRYRNYWMPVPSGTTRVDFRGTNLYNGPWQIQDISILSQVIPPGADAP